jgi:hypothetical protein
MHQQFNIQQLYALPTLYLFVLYLSDTAWKTEEPRLDSSQGQHIFLFPEMFISMLESNKHPIRWVKGAVYPGIQRQGVRLTIHLCLVSMLRMSAAIPPLFLMP